MGDLPRLVLTGASGFLGRRKGLFMASCRDLAERRADQGFAASELVIALDVLKRACLETLEPVPEAQGLGDEIASYRFTPRPPAAPPEDPGRRAVLRGLLALLGGGWIAGLSGGGCSAGADKGEGGETDTGPAAVAEEPLVLPLAALPPGERVRVVHRERPVELRSDGTTVTARSLVCTHFGCEVAWNPDRELYVCPCHEGAFAPDGRVVAGPPPRPLPELPVRVEGSRVVLEGA